jgi:hypothetical protein
MNKIYLLAPFVALALFVGIYVPSQRGREERALVKAAEIKAAHQAEQEARFAAERAAREAAIAEQLERKKERATREAREAAERDARAAALDTRDSAFRDQERLARQIERLKREIATEQEAVNRLQIDKEAALAEQTFLKTFVPQARTNAAQLQSVLEKIGAAETARAKQAAEDPKRKS